MITKQAQQTVWEGSDDADKAVAHYVNSGEAKPYGLPHRRALGLVGATTALGLGVGHAIPGSSRNRAIGAATGALIGAAGVGSGYADILRHKWRGREALKSPTMRELLNDRLTQLQSKNIDIHDPQALDSYLKKRYMDRLEREHQKRHFY